MQEQAHLRRSRSLDLSRLRMSGWLLSKLSVSVWLLNTQHKSGWLLSKQRRSGLLMNQHNRGGLRQQNRNGCLMSKQHKSSWLLTLLSVHKRRAIPSGSKSKRLDEICMRVLSRACIAHLIFGSKKNLQRDELHTRMSSSAFSTQCSNRSTQQTH